MRTIERASLFVVLMLGSACRAPAAPNPPAGPGHRGGVTFVRARCAQTSSCVLGQVVAAETAAPLSRATVFLEREDGGGEAVQITTLTDDQGVWSVEEPPAGSYRLRVFKRERRFEVRGLTLGQPGTTMVPVRLPQS
ncbi:carboxypeptidase-like regulatory domain-containing protein [Paraliomyxa miuraensis]|uniref:carboxypeptidase-like regulatory domain-containing protein n=1 Tax=Paraliomyxa miuraensis TaxID=376150 RepID=UPI00224CF429|nr:carboxypeptidase-like regulatory domain-containing protein [Paraliomyxa miuraensis]MCX4245054.1 carboxypeptidase-like regulatory domain-containing protein [Paraliomyxa miuraensis]